MGILLNYNSKSSNTVNEWCFQYPNVIGRRPARVVLILGSRGSTLESSESLGMWTEDWSPPSLASERGRG